MCNVTADDHLQKVLIIHDIKQYYLPSGGAQLKVMIASFLSLQFSLPSIWYVKLVTRAGTPVIVLLLYLVSFLSLYQNQDTE